MELLTNASSLIVDEEAGERLRDSVLRGFEWYRAARASRLWREALEEEVETRRQRLRLVLDALPIDSDRAVDGLLTALTLSDRNLYLHAYRVAALATSVGCAMRLGDMDMATLERAALLHDVGKLTMPDALLRKPAALTVDEQQLVRRYPQIGADLIARVPHLQPAAPLVRAAQERPDGLGYPHAAHGATVPIGARIIAVADAFDAMTRPRVFRDAITSREALLELERCAGTQFDPAVVDAFKTVVQRQ